MKTTVPAGPDSVLTHDTPAPRFGPGASAVFALRAARPERRIRAADLLAPRTKRADDPGEHLPTVIEPLRSDVVIPGGFSGAAGAAGVGRAPLERATKQQRLLPTARRALAEDAIAGFPGVAAAAGR